MPYFKKLNGYTVKDEEARQYIEELRNGKANVSDIDRLSQSMNELEEEVNELQCGSNPNLLINGDFRVNQRGLTTYETPNSWQGVFTVDRWMINGPLSKLVVGDGYVELIKTTDACFFRQKMEHSVTGKLTATVKVKALNGDVSCCMRTTDNVDNNLQSLNVGLNVIHFDGEDLQQLLIIPGEIGSSIQIEYIKLEHGEHATPFIPRLYAGELALCQRYYVKFSGAYYTFNNCLVIDKNNVMWISPHNVMRITPTITLNIMRCGIQHNASMPTDYVTISSVSINDNSSIHVIFAFGSNHGMSIGSNCSVVLATDNGSVEFDSEIY